MQCCHSSTKGGRRENGEEAKGTQEEKQRFKTKPNEKVLTDFKSPSLSVGLRLGSRRWMRKI
jgi:hypothetical protein